MVDNKRGKGYWKLNNSYLEHDEYQDGIIRIYDEIIAEYDQQVSLLTLWDYFKLKIKQFSISYGIAQASKFNNACKQLELMLDQVDKDIAQSNACSLDDIQRRRKLKEELDELYRKKSKGYQMRSRAKYVEDGERSTKYFLGLEKQRQIHNCISSLKNTNGQYVHSDKEILDTARQYHTIIRAVFVCLSVCSPTPPRSFDGSSPNLVGVCRWTSELPLRGSFLKRSTGQRVKRHFFGADDTRLRPHRCKRHTASFAEHGVFCPAKGTRYLRV